MKQSKETVIIMFLALLGYIAVYLFVAFIEADINFINWDEHKRLIVILFGSIACLGIVLSYNINKGT